MVFCNMECDLVFHIMEAVTILILIDGFLQSEKRELYSIRNGVTILILIDGFLQFKDEKI